MKQEKAHNFLNGLTICQFQLSGDDELVIALLYREELKRCNFTKYSFFHSELDLQNSIEGNFEFNYFDKIEKFPFPKCSSRKNSFDYNHNLAKLANETTSIEKALLQHFLQVENFRSTYILLDEENNLLVRNFT